VQPGRPHYESTKRDITSLSARFRGRGDGGEGENLTRTQGSAPTKKTHTPREE